MQQSSIMQLIKKSRSTTCGLDPLPTTLLKKCSDELPPVITQIVNLSLRLGCFPDFLKHAEVSPLLKADRLDPELLKNYRPISQLKFLGKIIERVVLSQVLEYLSSHNLFPSMQSAYRPCHNCETALLRVSNDILLALDGGDEAILLLLDYSAAFDTIKHEAFLSRLEKRYGICDVALSWFKSFHNRSQSVIISNSESKNIPVDYGVPQGSVIGPLVFALFAAPLQDIITNHGIQCMTYADDTQIYILLKNNERSSAIHRLQSCVSDIKLWSASNGMKLNDDKTEILHFTNKFRMCPQIDSVFFLGSSTIATVETARNLGVTMDRFLTMSKHVSNICMKAASFALHKIGTLRQFLKSSSN